MSSWSFQPNWGGAYLRNSRGTCAIRGGPSELFPEGLETDVYRPTGESAAPPDGSWVQIPRGYLVKRLPGESAAPPDWKEAVRRWQFLALNPDPMGEPALQRRTVGPSMLNRDGSNLGQYLWSLREASVDAFDDLLDALRFVLPYAQTFSRLLPRRSNVGSTWK